MSKGLRVIAGVLLAFVCLSVLHAWLNIGFDKLGLVKTDASESFRVGFLPVT